MLTHLLVKVVLFPSTKSASSTLTNEVKKENWKINQDRRFCFWLMLKQKIELTLNMNTTTNKDMHVKINDFLNQIIVAKFPKMKTSNKFNVKLPMTLHFMN